MADYSPIFGGGNIPFPVTTSAAVVGGTLVGISGAGTVATASAGAITVGVAAHDAASGAVLTVWPIAGVVHEIVVVAAATVTAADGVITAAGGLVDTSAIGVAAAAGTLLGVAITTATAGNKVQFVGRT